MEKIVPENHMQMSLSTIIKNYGLGIGIGMGVLFYMNYDKILGMLAKTTNSVVDKYLDKKYENYKIETDDLKPYHFKKMCLISLTNPSADSVIELQLNENTLIKSKTTDQEMPLDKVPERNVSSHIDMREYDITINLDEIRKKYANTLLYVYTVYGDETHIVPFHLDRLSQSNVTLPLYSAEDIDSCFKVEYDNICTNKKTHDDISKLVLQFSGPKGNFYNDIGYINIAPEYIICDKEYKSIMEDDSDHLKLESSLSMIDVFFKKEANIKLD